MGGGFNATPPCPPAAVAARPSRSRLLVALQVGQHPACRDQEAEERHTQRRGLLLGEGSTHESLGPLQAQPVLSCRPAGLSQSWTQAAPPLQWPAGPAACQLEEGWLRPVGGASDSLAALTLTAFPGHDV